MLLIQLSIDLCARSLWKLLRGSYHRKDEQSRHTQTAGPLERFNIWNWIPALSEGNHPSQKNQTKVDRDRSPATRAQTPSNASTSRTRVPLPTPPKDGLHDISPMVSSRCVKSTVRAPVRAAPAAASQPACPAPITTTRESLDSLKFF